MSKQEMARRLIALGSPKSFNTLRKYSTEMLEAMLQASLPVTVPEMELPVVEEAPKQPAIEPETYVPTDAEIMRVNSHPAVAVAELAPVEHDHGLVHRWMSLAMVPVMLALRIVGF